MQERNAAHTSTKPPRIVPFLAQHAPEAPHIVRQGCPPCKQDVLLSLHARHAKYVLWREGASPELMQGFDLVEAGAREGLKTEKKTANFFHRFPSAHSVHPLPDGPPSDGRLPRADGQPSAVILGRSPDGEIDKKGTTTLRR